MTAKKPNSVSKCLYFPDSDKLDDIVKLLERFPRSNLSSIFSQLVDPILEQLNEATPESRTITVTGKVWL